MAKARNEKQLLPVTPKVDAVLKYKDTTKEKQLLPVTSKVEPLMPPKIEVKFPPASTVKQEGSVIIPTPTSIVESKQTLNSFPVIVDDLGLILANSGIM